MIHFKLQYIYICRYCFQYVISSLLHFCYFELPNLSALNSTITKMQHKMSSVIHISVKFVHDLRWIVASVLLPLEQINRLVTV